jgi:hypothetical protein
MFSFLEKLNIHRLGPFTQFLVTGAVTFTFIGCLAILFYFAWHGKEFPPGLKETLLVLIGALGREFGNVCSFWLGTSIGSMRKTDIMADKS